MRRRAFVLLVLSALGAACGNASDRRCPRSVADYCAAGGAECDADLSVARARWSALCAASESSAATIATGCAGFVVVTLPNVDSVKVEVFDPGSGALIAVSGGGPPDGDSVCLAGPSSFSSPSCAGASVEVCPAADAGTDGP